MTPEESRDFLRQAFIAFPGVSQWLKDNSPDPQATIQVWSVALESIKASEAISVLNRWVKNELPPPTGYQRELFVQHVVAVVKQDRTKEYSAKHRDKVLDQVNANGHSRGSVPVLGSYMRDIMGFKSSYDLGQISFEELQRQVEDRKQVALEAVK
jgi:hypothetical protein